MRLLKSLTKFADDSSIHGLNYIAKSPSKTERIIWFILFTGALLYAGLQIGEEYRGWRESQTMVVVETLAEPIDKIQFPAVTICPQTFNSDRWGPTLKILDYLHPDCYFNGTCKSYQEVYHQFVAEVDNLTYATALKLTMTRYPACKTSGLLYPASIEEGSSCINQILADSSQSIRSDIDHIKGYALNQFDSTSIQTDFDKILANIDIRTSSKKQVEYALAQIKNASLILTDALSCFEDQTCLQRTREIIMRLKLIEWGHLRHKTLSTASLFGLHHGILGPYFSDIEGNEWPHIPLHKEPISLANDFNNLLTKLTFEMSNGTLKNVSLLDLPAFGSTIGTLKKGLKKQFVWPTKLNFAALKTNPAVSMTTKMSSYKTLTEDWRNYMQNLDKPNLPKLFTSQMHNNRYLNFTRFIEVDMKTFLTSIAGTFPTALKHSLPVWNLTAYKIFGHGEKDKFDQTKSLYDKLIIDCAFREDISLRGQPDGGCEGFYPTLTTNGMCYTFNGKPTYELWKPSKMINSFSTLFPLHPRNNKTFGGSRIVQGLQFWTNMKPYTNQHFGPSALAYTIGVTEQINAIDQKNNVYKLVPGFHTTVHVVPKVVETSSAFDSLSIDTRKCKLPSETTGFQLFQKYSRKGCEIECAARKAASFCKCLPWNYPNHFTTFPMCEMFGGFCFDEIMSNTFYYKDCQAECLVDCQEKSLLIWFSSVPLNTEVLCRGSYFDSFFKENFATLFAFESYQMLVQGQSNSDLSTALANGSLCVKYLKKYVALATIESPYKSVSKSTRKIAASFDYKLGIVGGTLAIFLGKD